MLKREEEDLLSDYLFKIVLVGDSGVGKSCLLLRFADDTFSESFISTIGVDFRFKTLRVDEKVVKLQIWDTAGQERFKTITGAYYRGADAIVIVFDKTNVESFENIPQWMEEIKKYAAKNIHEQLVGNKCDKQNPVVDEGKILSFAEEEKMNYVETSALSSYQVEFAFETLSRDLMSRKPVVKNLGLKVREKKKRLSCCKR